MPLRAGRITPRDMNDRDWATYVQQSGIQADRSIKSFTPTWGNDFSADPTGDISYYDFGVMVVLWVDTPVTGTSDTVTFSLAGLPEEIQPKYTGYSRIVMCYLADNNLGVQGGGYIDDSGTITFGLAQVVGTEIQLDTASFTAAGVKGLPGGWLFQYTK